MQRSKVFALAVAGGLTTAVFGFVGVADALPGADWASASAPLKVNYAGWKPAGYSYGIWQGVRDDQGRGDRLQDWSASKTRQTYNRGTYTKHSWYWNGSYCYLASFSEAGVSIGCGSGWHSAGATNSRSNNSTTWKYWETWKGLSATGNSGRAKLQTCFNVKAAPDTCSSGSFLRGSRY